MFNNEPSGASAYDDLTTAARIRAAAVAAFGEHGFGVGVRAIAAAAGVSPGLVIHHFGSKDGLRAACDDHVRDVVRRAKLDALRSPSLTGPLASLATTVDAFAPYVAYIVRSFQAGGPLMAELFEGMVADAEAYLRVGIDNGTLKPRRDVGATARLLALQQLGGLLLHLQLHGSSGGSAAPTLDAVQGYVSELLLPMVELLTDGLYADSTLLDTLLADERGATTKRGRQRRGAP